MRDRGASCGLEQGDGLMDPDCSEIHDARKIRNHIPHTSADGWRTRRRWSQGSRQCISSEEGSRAIGFNLVERPDRDYESSDLTIEHGPSAGTGAYNAMLVRVRHTTSTRAPYERMERLSSHITARRGSEAESYEAVCADRRQRRGDSTSTTSFRRQEYRGSMTGVQKTREKEETSAHAGRAHRYNKHGEARQRDTAHDESAYSTFSYVLTASQYCILRGVLAGMRINETIKYIL